MGRMLFRHCIAPLTISLLLTACTTHRQDTPSLSGPSGLGTSLVLSVSPDVLVQDGISQSLVQVQAYDSNGQPLRDKSMRVEIQADRAPTDFGRLSARNVVTDSNGRASVTYTAPAPILGVTSTVDVQIAVTPSESDFGNATTRYVTIHLMPSGVSGAPSPLTPTMKVDPATPTVGNPATFSATASGTGTSAQVGTFVWDFGNGDTPVGQSIQHTFAQAGSYLVTLFVIDTVGRVSSVTNTVTVTAGTLPTADIVVSPVPPVAVGQTLNFTASGSTAEPGHRLVDFSWNFGDGTIGTGVLVQHAYQAVGTYKVTLKVTDDVGRKSPLKTADVQVTTTGGAGTGITQANFTISPANPSGPTGSDVLVFFDGSGSVASAGGSILSYVWTFDTGAPATGQQTSRTFKAPGTYNVTLSVTDSQGKSDSKTRPFTVAGT